jgi:hypothetical protein
MKLHIRKFAVTMAALLLAAPAWSYTIGGGDVDVGDLDDFVDSTMDLNVPGCEGTNGSSETAEECWAESVTGEDLELGTKEEDVDFYITDQDPNVIAFMLNSGTGYYVVKNANANAGGGWVLMNNLIEFGWGVLDLDVVGSLLNLCQGNDGCGDELVISHVTPFVGDGDTDVSEPATLGLLGLGLLGVGFARRRRTAA